MDAYLIEISLRQLLKNGLIEEFQNSKELNESESIIKTGLLDVINSSIWIKDKYYGTAGVFDGKCLNIIRQSNGKQKSKKTLLESFYKPLDDFKNRNKNKITRKI